MRISILSRNRFLYSTRRIVSELWRDRVQVSVQDPSELVPSQDGSLLLNGQLLENADSTLIRADAQSQANALACARALSLSGTRLLNSATAIAIARDKFECAQVLHSSAVPVVPTIRLSGSGSMRETLSNLVAPNGFVLKRPDGQGGRGTVFASTLEEAVAIAEALTNEGRPLLAQAFVKEADGSDLRVIVLRGEAVMALRRRATTRDFRSNAKAGGIVESADLTDELANVARLASAAVGLGLAGIDLLETKHGLVVTEVNASPGIRGAEETTGANLAGMIAEALIHLAESTETGDEANARTGDSH